MNGSLLVNMRSFERTRSKFKLVTFDITGTLLRFKKSVGEQYAEAGSKFGIFLESDPLSKSFSKQWKQMNNDYPNYGYSAGLSWETWWHKIVHQTFIDAAPTVRLDAKKLDEVSHYLTEIFKEKDCWQLCDGTLDILEELNKGNTSVGVISNFDPRLEEILTNMGIRKYFKFIIASYTVGIEKPNPKIFQLAVELNNDKTVTGCEIIHVGNSPVLDLEAALRVGWNACLVNFDEYKHDNQHPKTNHYCQSNELSKLVFNDLHQLKSFLIPS